MIEIDIEQLREVLEKRAEAIATGRGVSTVAAMKQHALNVLASKYSEAVKEATEIDEICEKLCESPKPEKAEKKGKADKK